MGFLDFLTGKNVGNEILPVANPENPEAPGSAALEAYGLPPTTQAPDPTAPPASMPIAPPPGQTPGTPPPATPAPPAGVPTAPAPAAASSEGDRDPLDAPLRDLFTQASSMDPQLEALLKRVDKVDAKDLIDDLRQFSQSIGADFANDQSSG